LPEITIRKTFDTGSNYTHPSRKPTALIPLVGRLQGKKHPGRSHKNEIRANPYKGMTPPSTQNLKELGLWIFFLICCLTFLLEITIRKTFDTRSNCTRPSRKPTALITLAGRIRERNTGEISKNEN